MQAWRNGERKVEPGVGVVLEGRAPIWGYLIMAHTFHASSWIGQFDPRIGVIVVQTHAEEVPEGAIFQLTG